MGEITAVDNNAQSWSPSRIAAQRAAKRRPRYLLWIDMWPFTMVMLALLILFMTFAPPHHHKSVDLPVTRTARSEPGALRDDVMKIMIARDGNIFFRSNQVVARALPEMIHDAVKQGAERKVYLAVDARARYSDVEPVLDQIRYAGIQQVCFLAEKTAK
jgi:biopolymer transport protein ExbD